MLILEARYQKGKTYFGNDYSSEGMEIYRRYGYFRKVEKRYTKEEFEEFKPVGSTLYPIGTTVKEALLLLSEKRSLFNSTSPNWLAWLHDRSTDAKEGEELVSTVNPTVYRLRRLDEGE